MLIDAWWPLLRPETREWLRANNGDAASLVIVEEIAAVGGPTATDLWWADLDGSGGWCMPDDAVDWIEEVSNDEGHGS